MTSTKSNPLARSNWQTVVIVAAACAATVLLRVIALDSDAFPGLSWSSALLTDEGFYIHNARNLVLFGAARTDQFNNMLIMPALHVVQVLVFRIWGVGAVQARMITVAASLATVPLFYIAIDRSLGRRTAATATVFLALDHVYFLYNRLALMDSPATCVLIVMLYLWVLGLLSSGWKHKALLYGCGLSLVVAYAVRGLAASICFAPFAAIWLNSRSHNLIPYQRMSSLRAFLCEALPVACGLLTGIALYMVVWYLPNRFEMIRVNRYYFHQLMPSSFGVSASKAIGAIFGDARGMSAYLIRHSSAVFMLALAWIITRFGDLFRDDDCAAEPTPQPERLTAKHEAQRDYNQNISYAGRCTITLAVVWLSTLWIVLAVTEYSPSRYYLLCYPAMSIVGAHALWDMPALVQAIVRKPTAAAFLLGLAAYHVTLVVTERCFAVVSSAPIAVASFAAVAVSFAPILLKRAVNTCGAVIQSRIRLTIVAAVFVWGIINAGWTALWLSHLTYRQQNADRWLAEHLPAKSVLFGAVAPGLCMNNHFRAIGVIQGLCNDQDPLNRSEGDPRYVLILDDDWREEWWDRTYPGVLSKDNRVKTFPHILRSRFVVGVYKVPEAYKGELE